MLQVTNHFFFLYYITDISVLKFYLTSKNVTVIFNIQKILLNNYHFYTQKSKLFL